MNTESASVVLKWSLIALHWQWSIPGFHLYNLSLTLPLKVVLFIWFLCLVEKDYLILFIIYSAKFCLSFTDECIQLTPVNCLTQHSIVKWQGKSFGGTPRHWLNKRRSQAGRKFTEKLIVIRKESDKRLFHSFQHVITSSHMCQNPWGHMIRTQKPCWQLLKHVTLDRKKGNQ